MIQKMFCVSVVLIAVLALANASFAEEAKPAATAAVVAGCPCHHCQSACDPCHPPVVYRCGPLGCVRPVVYAPVIRPVYYPPRYFYRPYCAPAYPCGYPCYPW